METKTGTIIVKVNKRGFGFIKPDEAVSREENLFFHANDVLSPEFARLNIGDRVEFLVKEVKKGNGKAAYDVVAV
mgnify:CR=1 FL=1